MIRFLTIALAAACVSTTACATGADASQPDPTLDVTITREVGSESVLYAVVQMRNRSDHPICISNDILNGSFALRLILRRKSSGALPTRNPGYLPPPLEGVTALAPGASVTVRSHMSGSYAAAAEELAAYSDLEIQAQFTVNDCGNSAPYEIRKDWQPF